MYFLRCLFGWFTFLRWQAGFRPGSRVTFFQQSQKKVTKKKASHVRAASRSLALLAAFGALANSSPELSTPLNRLRRFPLQGTTPAARQSRLRGVPGRGCASLASPRLLVRCAHFAGGMKAGGAGRGMVDFRVKDGLLPLYCRFIAALLLRPVDVVQLDGWQIGACRVAGCTPHVRDGEPG